MKTLTIYALVLRLGVSTLLSDLDGDRPSYYAPLESLELETPTELLESFSLPGIIEPNNATTKKAYHIYFENKSREPIDVAIRFKDEEGEWQLDGLTKLKPGEKKKMAESIEKTYYYYASNIDLKSADNQSFKFPINHNSRKKLKFLKQEIWECYNSEMCNTFAVFR